MKRMFKQEAKHLALEVVLIIASVLIFWSGWALLDSLHFFDKTSTAIVTLIIGIIVTLFCLEALFRHEKEHP